MKLGEILAQQLALLPVQDTLLRTIVRTASAADAYAATVGHVRAWLETRAHGAGLRFDGEASSYRRGVPACRLEIERSEGRYAFALDARDERENDRRWVVEGVLTDAGEHAEIDVRLSVVRLQSAAVPHRHVPEFLRAIAQDVGLDDVRTLGGVPWRVERDDVDDFLELLTSPERSLAIVAVSEGHGNTLVDPTTLARRLVGVAHTVVLSENASWEITRTVAQEWSVFLGAVRRYAPGLRFADDVHRHRLWLAPAIERANATNPAGGFLEQCVDSIFAAATADFETAIPFATLRDVARERADEEAAAGSAVVSISIVDAEPVQAVGEAPSADAASADVAAAVLEEASDAEREEAGLDDAVRQRDETIQSLQAKNARLAGEIDFVQSVLAEYEAENKRLKADLGLLRGESAAFEGPLAGVLRPLAEALQRAQEIGLGVTRRDEQITALERDMETLAGERDALARERYGLMARIGHGETAGGKESVAGDAPPPPSYDDPDGFVEYLTRRYDGKIVVTKAARKSFRDLVYRDPQRLYDTVDVLGTDFYDMRSTANGANGARKAAHERFEQRLEEMRLTSGPTATAGGAGHFPEDHVVQFDGRTLPCEKIRDIGLTFDRQHFLCINFAWDAETQHVILKGFGHTATVSART